MQHSRRWRGAHATATHVSSGSSRWSISSHERAIPKCLKNTVWRSNASASGRKSASPLAAEVERLELRVSELQDAQSGNRSLANWLAKPPPRSVSSSERMRRYATALLAHNIELPKLIKTHDTVGRDCGFFSSDTTEYEQVIANFSAPLSACMRRSRCISATLTKLMLISFSDDTQCLLL